MSKRGSVLKRWLDSLRPKGPPLESRLGLQREDLARRRQAWDERLDQLRRLLADEVPSTEALDLLATFSGRELRLVRQVLGDAVAHHAPHLALLMSEQSTERLRAFVYDLSVEQAAEEALLEVLNDGDARARACAAQALAQVGTVASLRALEVAAAADPDRYVREFASLAVSTVADRPVTTEAPAPQLPVRARILYARRAGRRHQGPTWSRFEEQIGEDIRRALVASGIRLCEHPGEDADVTIEIDLESHALGGYIYERDRSWHAGVETVCRIRGMSGDGAAWFDLEYAGRPPAKFSTWYQAEVALVQHAFWPLVERVQEAAACLPDLVLLACSPDHSISSSRIERLAGFVQSCPGSVDVAILQRLESKRKGRR